MRRWREVFARSLWSSPLPTLRAMQGARAPAPSQWLNLPSISDRGDRCILSALLPFDELVIIRDDRKPQTVGMTIALSVVLLRRIELRLRRVIARPDAGPLQCHDIFSADGNDVRI